MCAAFRFLLPLGILLSSAAFAYADGGLGGDGAKRASQHVEQAIEHLEVAKELADGLGDLVDVTAAQRDAALRDIRESRRALAPLVAAEQVVSAVSPQWSNAAANIAVGSGSTLAALLLTVAGRRLARGQHILTGRPRADDASVAPMIDRIAEAARVHSGIQAGIQAGNHEQREL